MLKTYILIIAMTGIAFSSFGKKRNDPSKPFLETSITRSNVVEGEMLIYEVTLFTPDPDIAGIELAGNPIFDNLPVSRSAADNRLEETEVDGVRYYTAVIDRFFIDAENVGKHKLKGGAYRVGYTRRLVIEDPFWGPYITEKVEATNLEAPDVTVNVSELPLKGKPKDFSGAIGSFTIEVTVASDALHAGDEAYALIIISGEGDLSQAALPDVRSIFSDGLNFRSMTESRNHFVKEGRLGSEIEIECVFSPQREGEYKIGECSFSFYNPTLRKYERAVSVPIPVSIVPATLSKDSPTHYMDI